MAHVYSNPNPHNSLVGDCVVRALSLAMDRPWSEVYLGLCVQGLVLGDMPSSNRVWGEFLKEHGYTRKKVPDECPYCYTIRDFCEEHPEGTYIVCTGTHVVCCKQGNYMDTWDSGDETVLFYWEARNEQYLLDVARDDAKSDGVINKKV